MKNGISIEINIDLNIIFILKIAIINEEMSIIIDKNLM